MHYCIPTPTTDSNTSTGMIWVTLNIPSPRRSAANRQGNVMELSGNFTLSGEWSPCHQCKVTVDQWKEFYCTVVPNLRKIYMHVSVAKTPFLLSHVPNFLLWISWSSLTSVVSVQATDLTYKSAGCLLSSLMIKQFTWIEELMACCMLHVYMHIVKCIVIEEHFKLLAVTSEWCVMLTSC